MMKAAEKFSVSGSYLARVCSVLRVPRPEKGYWAKLNVGKAPPRPALPDALPGDQLSWSQEGDPPAPRVRAVTAASEPARQRVRRVVTGVHGLIKGARQHYERGYKVEEGCLLRPYRRQLVDVTASAKGLDKALAFANDLFNALESAGHRVCFASLDRPHLDEHEKVLKPRHQEYPYDYRHLWQPSSPTVVYVGSIPFGLAVIEMTEAVFDALCKWQVYSRIRIQTAQADSRLCRAHMDNNERDPLRPSAACCLLSGQRCFVVAIVSRNNRAAPHTRYREDRGVDRKLHRISPQRDDRGGTESRSARARVGGTTRAVGARRGSKTNRRVH
jgi:hypothetical protein